MGKTTSDKGGACPLGLKLVYSGIVSALLGVLLAGSDYPGGQGLSGGAWIAALFAAVCFFALFLAAAGGRGDSAAVFLCVLILTALSVALRAFQLNAVSGDYTDFLSKWARFFRENGGVEALGRPVGNYNVPYLCFLALISYVPLSDLYLIKLFSIVFDYLLAFYAMKTAAYFNGGRFAQLAVFFGVLFYPTVWLNSAFWGQCDSIYACFSVMSLYYAFRSRPVLSVAFAALAFSFKLQAVFFLPVLVLFLITKRIKIRHLLAFPAVYLLTVLPAMAFGRSLPDILGIYVNQAGEYDSLLTLNAPSVFAFVPEGAPVGLFKWLGIAAAALLILFVYGMALRNREKPDDRALFIAAILFSVGIPFLLPSMHERYFYLADAMGVIYAAVNTRRWFVPYAVLAASYAGYYAYLKRAYLFDMKYAAALLALVFVLLVTDYILRLRTDRLNTRRA